MSGYESDFVTGRSIGEGDRAAAIVIVPTTGGHPDAVICAAHAPVYPHDRFDPVSMILRGNIDERGFFSPDKKRPEIKFFLDFVNCPTWGEFQSKFLFKHRPVTLSPARGTIMGEVKAVPGLSLMHESTLKSVMAAGWTGDDNLDDAVERAVKITLDAMRSNVPRHYEITQLRPAHDQYHVTVAGEEIEVPYVQRSQSSSGFTRMNPYALNALRNFHDKAADSDGSMLRAIFRGFGEYQQFADGLHTLGKFLQPSKFARGDNLLVTTHLNLFEIEAAVTGISKRPGFDPEYNDAFDSDLEKIASRLRTVLATVERELELGQQTGFKP